MKSNKSDTQDLSRLLDRSYLETKSIKLNKSDIQHLSKLLGWSYAQTKKAINHTRKFDLTVSCDDILKLCMNSKDEDERFAKLVQYSIMHSLGDEIEFISRCLLDDDIFYICTLFNLIDDSKSLFNVKVKFDYDENFSTVSTPFLIYKDIYDINDNLIYKWGVYRERMKTFKFRFMDMLIMIHVGGQLGSHKGSFREINNLIIEDLVLELIPTSGFSIFESPYIQTFINDAKIRGDNREFLMKVVKRLSDPFLNRKKHTEKRYWLIFCLVEKVKESNHGTLESFRITSELLTKPVSTIQRRYYAMQSQKAKLGLDIDEIIKEQGLKMSLLELLREIPTPV